MRLGQSVLLLVGLACFTAAPLSSQAIVRFAPVQLDSASSSPPYRWPATCSASTGNRILGGVGGAVIGAMAGTVALMAVSFGTFGGPENRDKAVAFIIGSGVVGAVAGAVWIPCRFSGA